MYPYSLTKFRCVRNTVFHCECIANGTSIKLRILIASSLVGGLVRFESSYLVAPRSVGRGKSVVVLRRLHPRAEEVQLWAMPVRPLSHAESSDCKVAHVLRRACTRSRPYVTRTKILAARTPCRVHHPCGERTLACVTSGQGIGRLFRAR